MQDEKAIYKNDYISLDDLVYAPLHAVSESNMKLSTNIIELINKTGSIDKGPDGEEVIKLKTINLAYKQIKNDETDTQQIEEVELKIPLLSIFPISGLQVNNAAIKFNVEINGIVKDGDERVLSAQVSARNTRHSDHLPKFSYEIDLKNTPCPEGLLRFMDILNINPIPAKLASSDIDEDGRIASGKFQEYYNNLKRLKKIESKLNKACSKLSLLIDEKKRLFGSTVEKENLTIDKEYNLFLSSGNDGEDKLRELSEKNPSLSYIMDLHEKIKKYSDSLREMEDKLHSIKEEIIMNEINSIQEGLYDE